MQSTPNETGNGRKHEDTESRVQHPPPGSQIQELFSNQSSNATALMSYFSREEQIRFGLNQNKLEKLSKDYIHGQIVKTTGGPSSSEQARGYQGSPIKEALSQQAYHLVHNLKGGEAGGVAGSALVKFDGSI